eukprot:11224343-Lingulodinium_polyedra.AAC.1
MPAPRPKPSGLCAGSEPACRITKNTLWLTAVHTASVTVWSKTRSTSGPPIMGQNSSTGKDSRLTSA